MILYGIVVRVETTASRMEAMASRLEDVGGHCYYYLLLYSGGHR